MPDIELKEQDIINKSNVKDWIQIGGFLIAAQLTIIALVWQAKPSSGIYWATFLLMMSFACFVNSVFSNSKAHFLIKLIDSTKDEEIKKKEELTKKVKRIMKFGYYTFSGGYTLILVGFTLLAYKYMIDFIGYEFMVLLLPIFFMGLLWLLLVVFTYVKTRGDPIYQKETGETEFSENKNRFKFLKEIFEIHKVISITIEIIVLSFIGLDFFRIWTII